LRKAKNKLSPRGRINPPRQVGRTRLLLLLPPGSDVFARVEVGWEWVKVGVG